MGARDRIALVPATATLEEANEILGPAPERPARSEQEQARLSAFGGEATALMRINVELPADASGHRPFWNAADVEEGAFSDQLGGAGVLPRPQAERLAARLRSLLQAAEAVKDRALVEVFEGEEGRGLRLAFYELDEGPAAVELTLDDVESGLAPSERLGPGGPHLVDSVKAAAEAAAGPVKQLGLSWSVRTFAAPES